MPQSPAELPDYYEILEISPRASIETIKAAYKALCKKYHPDASSEGAQSGDVRSGERMIRLNEAYAILSDESRRRDYDARLRRQAAAASEQTSHVSHTSHEDGTQQEKTDEQKAKRNRMYMILLSVCIIVSLVLIVCLAPMVIHLLS